MGAMGETLKSRVGCIFKKYAHYMDRDTATFLLYNLGGQLKGYQRYQPSSEGQKYFTYSSEPSIFGLSELDYSLDTLYVTEGIFDAMCLGYLGNSVAVLCNNPKRLREQLAVLPFHTVAVCDGDEAGRRLAKFTDSAVYLPEGEDVNSIYSKYGLEALSSLVSKSTKRP